MSVESNHQSPIRTGANAAVDAPVDPSIGKLVYDATQNISTLIRGEVELAKLELRSSVKNASTGIIFFIAAGVLIIFSLTFGLIAFAEGLIALHIWRWAAYLIVFASILLLAGLLGFAGFKKVRRVKAPAQTIQTTKDTVAYLRDHPKTATTS